MYYRLVETHDHVHDVLEQWRREKPELDRRPMGVIGRLSRLAQLLQLELEPVFAAHELNGGEFDVLAALRRSGRPYRLTPTELSRALMVTSGGMTKRLSALESRGLIRRNADPTDGRSSIVTLSADGRRLVDSVVEDHVANEERLLSGLDSEQRAALAELLEALAVSLGDVGTGYGARGRARAH